MRGAVAYGAARRRLGALSFVATEGDIRAESPRESYGIDRGEVARITEIQGPLGGLRIESRPRRGGRRSRSSTCPAGVTTSASCVRTSSDGGRSSGAVAGTRSFASRLAASVVAAIFFVPFLLEDFVAQSKAAAAALVLGTWLVMRAVLRRG
ncbi:MAG: hypothetical protein JOZ69_01510 [Myxococcales bacterium]|nr:hypothetical protein [Myxococcales bacterium]